MAICDRILNLVDSAGIEPASVCLRGSDSYSCFELRIQNRCGSPARTRTWVSSLGNKCPIQLDDGTTFILPLTVEIFLQLPLFSSDVIIDLTILHSNCAALVSTLPGPNLILAPFRFAGVLCVFLLC